MVTPLNQHGTATAENGLLLRAVYPNEQQPQELETIENRPSDGGFFVHPRALKDWRWRKCAYHYSLFMYLLEKCAYKDYEEGLTTIKEGQVYTSINILCDEIGANKRTIKKVIDDLVNSGEIRVIMHRYRQYYTLFEIVNYERFTIGNSHRCKNAPMNENFTNHRCTHRCKNAPMNENHRCKNAPHNNNKLIIKKNVCCEVAQQTQQTKQTKQEKKNDFKTPTKEELLKYAKSIGKCISDAELEKFLQKNESYNWKKAKENDEGWRPLLVRWIENIKEQPTQQQPPQQSYINKRAIEREQERKRIEKERSYQPEPDDVCTSNMHKLVAMFGKGGAV